MEENTIRLGYAQSILAQNVTKLVHGGIVNTSDFLDVAAENAHTRSNLVFGNMDVSATDLLKAFKGDEVFSKISKEGLIRTGVLDIAVLSGVCKTKSAGRKLVKEGGLYIVRDGKTEKVGVGMVIEEDMIIDGRVILMRSGKTKYSLIELI